jgi:hypothetical protein
MAVPARLIVKGIDVISYIGDRQLPTLIDLFLDSFFRVRSIRAKSRASV